jgi:acetate kinase
VRVVAETILVVNAGSSSIKFQLFAVSENDELQRRMRGQVDGIGVRPRLTAKDGRGDVLADCNWQAAEVGNLPAALERIIIFLREQIGSDLPEAVGHRVVHGGPDFEEAVVVDEETVKKLERLAPLAPLHQPNNLAPIHILLARRPDVLQVACFDTAFHRGHPAVADRFAIPETLFAEGVRRYGFHGLSYEFISRKLFEIAPDIAGKRVIVAHLGSGASMCALHAGRSVESTMGFTALDGLPMGTRPGQLDAGVVLYLLTEKGMSAGEIERLLYHECGLKGLSGISSDVRALLASAEPAARLALDYFIHKIALFAGMLTAAMDGVEGFVFTAGVGENAPTIRDAVAKRLTWLGLEIDPEANAAGRLMVSTPGSRVACYVIPTDEELMIASHTLQALRRERPPHISARPK